MSLSTENIVNLNSVPPLSLYSYLKDNGWSEERKIDTRASILTINKRNRKFSVLLPLEKELPDYDSRMYDVFRTLEVVEERPKEEIITGLQKANEIAKEKRCEIISLKFKFVYCEEQRQFPAKKMGMVLTSLQELFDAVGQSETGRTSNNGKIPKEILDRTQLSVFETFKGSFGVKLSLEPNPTQLEMFDRPLAERVAENFIELLKRSNKVDKEELKEFLLRLKRRSASKYRKFLMSLISSDSNFYVDWGSVTPDKGGQASLSLENTIGTVEFINKMEVEEPEEYIINGELISASKIKKTLEIEDLKEGKKYLGEIAESLATNQEVDLTIGRLYSAKIQEITSINPATGEEKIERTVTELSYLSK